MDHDDIIQCHAYTQSEMSEHLWIKKNKTIIVASREENTLLSFVLQMGMGFVENNLFANKTTNCQHQKYTHRVDSERKNEKVPF